MPLDPQVKRVMEQIEALNLPPRYTLPPHEARVQYEERMAAAPPGEAVTRVEDRTIPGPDGEIPVRVYTPSGDGPFPILVYFHGGG